MHGSSQRRLGMAFAVVLATVAALLTPPVASAVINGQLKQLLPSLGGCLTNAPGATGCKAVNAQLGTIGEPAFSPDGRFLYVPTRAGNNLITFERDPVTGVLTERKCIRFNSTAGGCSSENVSPLEDATGVAVSPNL